MLYEILNRKRQAIEILLALLLSMKPALALAGEFQTPAITVTELLEQQASGKNIVVVDVRKSGEYKSGHVPGAVNIPHDKLDKKLDKLSQADSVVLYCFNGKRTRQAEQTLLDNHFENVFHLEGGLTSWRQHGRKLKTGWGP